MDGRQTAPLRQPNPALPHREDCWSEGESSVLIDAWGDRYVELNRGNLRQKQWQEVADAVNSRPCDARRPPRTDIQCKNRIDTLKKKYKAEKSRIAAAAADNATSSWIFFDRLDYLIKKPTPTPTPTPTSLPPSSSSPPLALPLPSHFKNYPLPTATLVHPIPNQKIDSFYRKRSRSNSSSSSSSAMKKRARSRKVAGGEEEEEEDEFRELSELIVRFGEIYEKVEMEKQRQTMELERERVEFAKSVEVKRLEMFADMQVRLAKTVRERRGVDRRIKGRSSSSSSSSSSAAAAALSFLLQPVMF